LLEDGSPGYLYSDPQRSPYGHGILISKDCHQKAVENWFFKDPEKSTWRNPEDKDVL